MLQIQSIKNAIFSGADFGAYTDQFFPNLSYHLIEYIYRKVLVTPCIINHLWRNGRGYVVKICYVEYLSKEITFINIIVGTVRLGRSLINDRVGGRVALLSQATCKYWLRFSQ